MIKVTILLVKGEKGFAATMKSAVLDKVVTNFLVGRKF